MLSQLLQLYHVDGLSSSWSTNWIKGYGEVEGSVRFCMFSQIVHPLLLPPRFCPELLFWRLKANTADSFLTDFALEWWLSKGQSLERFSASSTGFLKTFMWKLLPYFLWKKALVASFKQWVNLVFLSSTKSAWRPSPAWKTLSPDQLFQYFTSESNHWMQFFKLHLQTGLDLCVCLFSLLCSMKGCFSFSLMQGIRANKSSSIEGGGVLVIKWSGITFYDSELLKNMIYLG